MEDKVEKSYAHRVLIKVEYGVFAGHLLFKIGMTVDCKT